MKFNILSLLFLGMLTGFVGCAGCESGTNFSELDLDANQVIDYGRQVTEGKAPKEAVIYGQLLVGDSSGPSGMSFEGEQKELLQDVAKLRSLPKTTGVNFGAQEAGFLTFVDDLNNKITAIAPQIAGAAKNAKAAKDLASALEPDLKTGGKLEALLQTGETNVPAGAKAGFDALKIEVTDSFGRLYKSAVVLAQSLMQKEANSHVAKIKAAINSLETNAKDKIVFAAADYDNAILALQDTSNKLDAVGNFIAMFTSKTKVGNGFINSVTALNTAITQINIDYVGKAQAAVKPEATSLYDDAKQAGDALTKLANDYAGGAGIEQLKANATDTALDALSKAAFSQSVGAPGGDLRVENPTDTNNLMSMLANTSVVGMPSDGLSQFMVYSLAAGVVSNVQERFGLQVSNVLGLNPTTLIQAKNAYGMDDNQFKKFVTSRADLLRKKDIEAGRNDIYVLFANDLVAAGADTMAVVDAFSAGGGKVLVVSSDLSGVREKGQIFFPKNLSIAEAIATASAALENDAGISPSVAGKIADKIGRMTVAMGTPLKLNAVGALAKDAALRVKGQATPTDKAVELAVKGALITQGLPTLGLDNSGVLTADLTVLQKNVDKDPQYYAKMGAGRDDIGLRIEELGQMKKTQEENRRLRETIVGNNKKDQVKVLAQSYQDQLEGIKTNFDLPTLFSNYNNALRIIEKDAEGTLDSMENLLKSDLCRFKAQNEVPRGVPPQNRRGDYDNSWEAFTNDPNGPTGQAYDEVSIKNPLSLFNVQAGRVTVKPVLTLTPSQKAAISLNCFLTGPTLGNKYDGQKNLLKMADSIRVLVRNTSDEAKDLAARAAGKDIGRITTNLAQLYGRTNDTDPSYWGTNFQAFDNGANPTSIFEPLEKLFGYYDSTGDPPRTSTDSLALLPKKPLYRTRDLPVYFLSRFFADLPSPANATYRAPGNLNTTFEVRGVGVAANVWTIGKVYGSLVNPAIDAALVGAAKPVWIPAKAEFEKLNSRLWAWFVNRFLVEPAWRVSEHGITGMAPLNSTFEIDSLHAPQNGKDWFDSDNLIIGRLIKETQAFTQKGARYVVAEIGLRVVREYKLMLDLLYGLPPDDFNAFLNAVPETDLAKAFKSMEAVLTNASLITDISTGNNGQVDAWFTALIPVPIFDRLPSNADPNGFLSAAPAAQGANSRLNKIWPALQASAKGIDQSLTDFNNVMWLIP